MHELFLDMAFVRRILNLIISRETIDWKGDRRSHLRRR